MQQPMPKRPGRPANATPDDVLRVAAEDFLAGRRIDVQRVVAELGVSRATVYRWFGSRDGLVGDVMATLMVREVRSARARTRGHGARALLRMFDRINRDLAGAPALRTWLETEREKALQILTSSTGRVQPRVVAEIEAAIRDEMDRGAFSSPMDANTLAYAIVRVAEAFLFNDAYGVRGDVTRLRKVEAALLGVPPRHLKQIG
jgi:AcrR family transcriptional regulator